MRLFDNKKGQEVTTSKVFYWLIGLIISIWLVFSIWGFGATFFASLTKTPYQLNEDLFISRVTNTCFSWTEQTTAQQSEVHPSIIDLSKISDTRIHECFVGEDILPTVTIDVRPLPTDPNAFQVRRAILLETDSKLSPLEIIKNMKPAPAQERYVLVKEVYHKEFCGLRKDALLEANKQNDCLFNMPVELSEDDFKAIEDCITDAVTLVPNNPNATCLLSLSAQAAKYNPQPKLSDFCYSKVGACTYQDFVADYKGICQVKTTTGKLMPAELKVTFYG